jgi:hypothetical protein
MVLLAILGVSSHRSSLLSYWFGSRVFVWSGVAGCLHAFYITIPSLMAFMGFYGCRMPGHTAHYFGHWVVRAFIGHVVGYVASSRLCFLSTLLVGWLGEP